MTAINPQAKGASYERSVCRRLSLWVTEGKHDDCFWRSPASGGAATLAGKKLIKQSAHAGDIVATREEGLWLTDDWFVECKAMQNLALEPFVLKRAGLLAKHWDKTVAQAAQHDKLPIMFVKPNRLPELAVFPASQKSALYKVEPGITSYLMFIPDYDILIKTMEGLLMCKPARGG